VQGQPSSARDQEKQPEAQDLPAEAVCETPEPEPSSTCGEAFALPPDRAPPSLELTGLSDDSYTYRLEDGQAYQSLELALRVEDEGWGVQQVGITLLGADETVLFERVDEVAPYGVEELRVPPGTFELSVTARDHAGNSSVRVVHLQVLSPVSQDAGCAVTRFSPTGESAALSLFALSLLLLARRVARP
jgi:hypothetical protein